MQEITGVSHDNLAEKLNEYTKENNSFMIVIVLGLPGSGKSYFAYRLANQLKADYISSDRLRRDLFAETIYSEKEKLSVYSKMLKEIKDPIRQNKNLVFDATFYRNDIREQFIKEATGHGNKIIFIEI